MAGIKDFLMGSGALKKAAQTGDQKQTPAPAPVPSNDSDLGDIAKRNAEYAAKRQATQKQSSPLATPMGSTKAPGKAGKK